MRILIVDDHEIVREGLKAFLRDDLDFEVVAETGSAEGSSSWREEPIRMWRCSMPACPASAAPRRAGSWSRSIRTCRCSRVYLLR